MASVIPGGKYETAGTILSSASETSVLSCAAARWYFVTSINITHNAGTATTARLVVYRANTATSFALFHDKVVPLNDALSVEFSPIVLKENDELRVTSVSDVHVVVNYISEARING